VVGPAVSIREDWHSVARARQAVSDASDVRTRLAALFEFQRLLLNFAKQHWAFLTTWFELFP
jgi:hypothetical protein